MRLSSYVHLNIKEHHMVVINGHSNPVFIITGITYLPNKNTPFCFDFGLLLPIPCQSGRCII